MTFRDFRRRADAVRSIPLEIVLARWGAQRDRHDKARWQTERGPVSLTGCKFFNWHLRQGGGGAIDLVMQLGDMEAPAAIQWLEWHLGSALATSAGSQAPVSSSAGGVPETSRSAPAAPAGLRLPLANLAKLHRVRQYLTQQRCLAVGILEPLIEAGKVYADQRGNAVFLMVAGKANRPIGAELRGTGPRVWHGLAPGTRKDAGYFWVGATGGQRGSQNVVLCESAIDAISCFQLHAIRQGNVPCICISTAGVRTDAPWLTPLLACGYQIHCGFDNDAAGETASCRMISRHRSIKRLRPPAHDWNDALRASG